MLLSCMPRATGTPYRELGCLVCGGGVRVTLGRPRRSESGNRAILLYRRMPEGFVASAAVHEVCFNRRYAPHEERRIR